MMVPRSAASSSENSVLPGTQPSCSGQVPAAALVALADDDVDAVVLHVERLAAALHAVAEDGDGLVAEDGLDSLRRIVRPLDDGFRDVADLDLPHD